MQIMEMETADTDTASSADCLLSLGADGSVDVRGDLDLHSAPALLALVRRVVRDRRRRGIGRMEIRCADLEFCDSSGVAALIRASRCAQEAGIAIALTGCAPYLVRLLSISGVVGLFEVEIGGVAL